MNEEDQYELNECTKSLIEAFENSNPNIEIEIIFSSFISWPSVYVAQFLEEYPDIMWVEQITPLEWVKEVGSLAKDLAPYLENDNIDISIYGDDASKLYLEETNAQFGLPTSGGGAIMMADSWHEDAAWEFIKFICGEEGAKIYAEYAAGLDEENEN